MISDRLHERLDPNRPGCDVHLRVPVDVLEDLLLVAGRLGYESPHALMQAYIGRGLRKDLADALEKNQTSKVDAEVAEVNSAGERLRAWYLTTPILRLPAKLLGGTAAVVVLTVPVWLPLSLWMADVIETHDVFTGLTGVGLYVIWDLFLHRTSSSSGSKP